MDIEGAEVEALKGMAGTLSRVPKVVIITELCPQALKLFGTSAEEFMEQLDQSGLSVHAYRAGRWQRCDRRELLSEVRSLESAVDLRRINLLCTKGH